MTPSPPFFLKTVGEIDRKRGTDLCLPAIPDVMSA